MSLRSRFYSTRFHLDISLRVFTYTNSNCQLSRARGCGDFASQSDPKECRIIPHNLPVNVLCLFGANGGRVSRRVSFLFNRAIHAAVHYLGTPGIHRPNLSPALPLKIPREAGTTATDASGMFTRASKRIETERIERQVRDWRRGEKFVQLFTSWSYPRANSRA